MFKKDVALRCNRKKKKSNRNPFTCKKSTQKCYIIPNNKNQHLIPQFYQRNLSNDGKSIGKYVIHLRKTVIPPSIKDTASEYYYYDDKDFIESGKQTIEATLGMIETGASIAIKKQAN